MLSMSYVVSIIINNNYNKLVVIFSIFFSTASILGFPDSKPDLFVAWASSRLSLAERSIVDGSWFPGALCDVFVEYADREDLYTMMLRVKSIVYRKCIEEQSVEIVDRLQHKIFFR